MAFPEQGRETLLVVEDEACVRSLAVLVLKSHGYRVLEAASGPEALRVSEQHEGPIHLLITNVVMPNMNGRELAGLLRSQRPGMAVIYMSGYADDAILQLGTSPLETAFVAKPFAVEDLLWKIRTVLNAVASQPRMVVPTNFDDRPSVEQR